MLHTEADSFATPLDERQALQGDAMRFVDSLDRAIIDAALAAGAEAIRFGPLISMETLDRAGYRKAFPHLVTVPVAMTAACGCGQNHEGAAQALIPAACLPVYRAFENTDLAAPALVTTENTCWRREAHFEPLKRQWAFTMREIVCIGSQEEIRAFRNQWRDYAARMAIGLGLDADFQAATDPFFGQAAAARLYQAVSEAKAELVVDGLAIASINNHGSHFARAFDLRRSGVTARSACIAFGLERWLAAMQDRHGDDPAIWPTVRDLHIRQE